MTYFTQAVMADDIYLRMRVSACAAQEGCTDVGIDPDQWTQEWKKVWAAAPGWDAAWESAQANNKVDIGMQPDVITDGQVLGQVQAMMPFIHVSDNAPEAGAPLP